VLGWRMVGLDDLRSLFQSVILWMDNSVFLCGENRLFSERAIYRSRHTEMKGRHSFCEGTSPPWALVSQADKRDI